MRLAMLASGRGTNVKAILARWQAGTLPVTPVCVVCNVPDAGALDVARSYGVEALEIDHRAFASREAFDTRVRDELVSRQVDYVMLAGFMRLLSPVFVRAFPGRIINVHPSLLPAFKGGNAVRDALAYGVKVTGVTVHLVDEGLDSGPILLQAATAVDPSDSEDSLHEKLHAIEHELVPEALARLSKAGVVVEGRVARFPA